MNGNNFLFGTVKCKPEYINVTLITVKDELSGE